MKKISYVLFLIILAASLSACQRSMPNYQEQEQSENEYEGESKMELTQRQLDILTQAELPIEYDKLNDEQKKAIIAIEEMFCYLDEKYDMVFEYQGYRAESPSEVETLIVQPEGGTSADTISVIRKDGVCTDNYATVYYRDDYESMLKEYIQLKFAHVDVYSEISEVITDKTIVNQEELLSNISATSGIYFMDSEVKEEQLEEFAKEFGQWYVSGANGQVCSFSFYIVPEDTYWSLTKFNRADYNEMILKRINVFIHADGNVVIR